MTLLRRGGYQMKICNWCRKLACTLAAGGLLTSSAALAANLDTNLVVDPSFENVDLGTTGNYNSVKLNSWSDGTQPGFAYSYIFQPTSEKSGIPLV
jgi:hypothetical protein